MAEDRPISYEALAVGTAVLTASGATIGTVEHVLAVESLDLFDGIVVTTTGGIRFIDAAKVGRITTDAVHTTISDQDAATLPEPDGDEVFHANPEQDEGDSLSAHFGRLFRREHWKQDR
ncbi:MAG: PRC-barrel domain-containing protein [Steroidobacteraceae bacterium]